MTDYNKIIQETFVDSKMFTITAHQGIWKSSQLYRNNYYILSDSTDTLQLMLERFTITLSTKTTTINDGGSFDKYTPRITTYTLLYNLYSQNAKLEFDTLFNNIMQNIEDIFGIPLEEIFEGKVSYIQ
jgi:hypothetical protein